MRSCTVTNRFKSFKHNRYGWFPPPNRLKPHDHTNGPHADQKCSSPLQSSPFLCKFNPQITQNAIREPAIWEISLSLSGIRARFDAQPIQIIYTVAQFDIRPILLADDSPEDRILIPRAIKKAGLPNPLISLEDGEEALKYFAGEPPYADRVKFPLPSLVLLDIKMPKCDGFEVLEFIRTRLAVRIPVVMLTSSNLPEDIEKATRLGADSYFVKPACFTELIAMIKQLQDGSARDFVVTAQSTAVANNPSL